MKRREAVKAMAIGAAAPAVLLSGRSTGMPTAPATDFISDWPAWPDMAWVGPAYWGNSLQDWQLQQGKVLCNVSDRDRTLHCLTHQLSNRDEPFEAQITVALRNQSVARTGHHYVGWRVGAQGPFEDYRSAAVFGEGLAVGLTTGGQLLIGDTLGNMTLRPDQPVRLVLQATPGNGTYTLQFSAYIGADTTPVAAHTVSSVPSETLRGNIALVAHFEGHDPRDQPAATFDQWQMSGTKFDTHQEQTFGPICFAQYTLHNQRLKLSAQLAPIEAIADHTVQLQIQPQGAWQTLQQQAPDPMGRSVLFSADWPYQQAVPYRVRVGIPMTTGTQYFDYAGTIAREPKDRSQLKLAVFSCNMDHGFPDSEVVENVQRHAPDMAAFLGDQFYEATGPFGIQVSPVEKAALDYLYRWYMFGWSYRDIFRHIPSACIPDDHDVYHGNVWGEGGEATTLPPQMSEEMPNGQWNRSGVITKVLQDSGGYKMPPEWVNMVQRTQTGHLPDPYDPTPVKQGIRVYYTHWNYAGVSFAILEDRKFKSAPQNALPKEAQVVNGFCQNPDFDVREHPTSEADLLGERQLTFLQNWAADWKGDIAMKAVFSQTNFCTVATLPQGTTTDDVVPQLVIPPPGEYVKGDAPTQDMDSNGWPSHGRDEAVRAIRKCFALHIAGDQHLASVVHYGVEEHGDSGFAFAGPALNNVWPRRWWPPMTANHQGLPGKPAYTGDFQDGFGNRMTVHAVANPRQTGREPSIIYDRVTGYGIVTFDKQARTAEIACWPRYVNPLENPQGQYEGWPITVKQQDNYARRAQAYLDTLVIQGVENAVVEVISKADNELVYALRIPGEQFQPHVFASGQYTVRVSDPDSGKEQILTGLIAQENSSDTNTTTVSL